MELIAVRAAIVLVYVVPLERLNPLRKATDRDITQRLIARYGFLKYPRSYQDFHDENGATFADGTFDGVHVAELKVFSNGFLIDAGESTDVAERFFDDMTTVWREADLNLSRESVTSKVYNSQLAVRSDVDLIAPNAGLLDVIDNWFPNRSAGVSAIGIQLTGDADTPPSLRIERLAGSPLQALEFYSQAPLPTTLHISFLTRWETVQRESNLSSATAQPPQP